MSRDSTVRSMDSDPIEAQPEDVYAMDSVQSSTVDVLPGQDTTGHVRDTFERKKKKEVASQPRQHSGPQQHSTNYLKLDEMPLPRSRSHSDFTTVTTQPSPRTTGRVKRVATDGHSDDPGEQNRLQHSRDTSPTKLAQLRPQSQSHFRPVSPQTLAQPTPPTSVMDVHSAYPLNHQFNLTSGGSGSTHHYTTPQPYTTSAQTTPHPHSLPTQSHHHQPRSAFSQPPRPGFSQPPHPGYSQPLHPPHPGYSQPPHPGFSQPPRPTSSQPPPVSNNFFELMNGPRTSNESPPTMHPNQRREPFHTIPPSNNASILNSVYPMSMPGMNSTGPVSSLTQSNNFFETGNNSVHVPYHPNVAPLSTMSDLPPYLQPKPPPDNSIVSIAVTPQPVDHYHSMPSCVSTAAHPNALPNAVHPGSATHPAMHPLSNTMHPTSNGVHPMSNAMHLSSNTMHLSNTMHPSSNVVHDNAMHSLSNVSNAMHLSSVRPTSNAVHPMSNGMHPDAVPSAIPHIMFDGDHRASSVPPETEEQLLPLGAHPPEARRTTSLPIDKSKKAHIPNNFFDRDDVKIMRKKGMYIINVCCVNVTNTCTCMCTALYYIIDYANIILL